MERALVLVGGELDTVRDEFAGSPLTKVHEGAQPRCLGEFVRAHAFARLRTLPEGERARWAKRCDALSRELGLDTPAPRGQTISAFVWAITVTSLEALRSALQEAPAWLVDHYGDEERRRFLHRLRHT